MRKHSPNFFVGLARAKAGRIFCFLIGSGVNRVKKREMKGLGGRRAKGGIERGVDQVIRTMEGGGFGVQKVKLFMVRGLDGKRCAASCTIMQVSAQWLRFRISVKESFG